MSQTTQKSASAIVWETREEKARWREKEGWFSEEDYNQIIKDMARDISFRHAPGTESFCTV